MGSLRVCLDCPTLIPVGTYRGRCLPCRRTHDRDRGSRADRGYGREHRRTRAWWQSQIDSGTIVTCWRCHKRILGRRWALDHSEDRTTYRGPACEQCNGHLAGRAAHGLEPD